MQDDRSQEQPSVRFIPFTELGRLNTTARMKKKSYLDRDTPILEAGCNVPIILALPGIVEAEWVVCLVPTDRTCLEHVRLDIHLSDFNELPVITA